MNKQIYGDQTNEELVEDIVKYLYSGQEHAQLVGMTIMLTGKTLEEDSEGDRKKVRELAEWAVALVLKGRGDRSIHVEKEEEKPSET